MKSLIALAMIVSYSCTYAEDNIDTAKATVLQVAESTMIDQAYYEGYFWQGFTIEEISANTNIIDAYASEIRIDANQIYLDPYADDGGGKIGNGGRVLKCNDGIYMLDYIWGISAYGFFPETFEGDNEFAKASKIIYRLKEKDPYRFQRYLQDLMDFKKESIFLSNYRMYLTNDSSEAGAPLGCDEIVVINQITPQFVDEYRYRIDLEIFNELDNDTKAALIVHEIIYKEAIQLGHSNADSVMYFNAYLGSKRFQLDSKQEYQRKIIAAGFAYQRAGLTIDIRNAVLGERGTIIRGMLSRDSTTVLNGGEFTFVSESEVTFYPSGSIETGWITTTPQNSYRTPRDNASFLLGSQHYSSSLITFHETGFPYLIEVASGTVELFGEYASVLENSFSTFHDDGSIASFYTKDAIHISMGGNLIHIEKESELKFDSDGNLYHFRIGATSKINGKRYRKGIFHGRPIINNTGNKE